MIRILYYFLKILVSITLILFLFFLVFKTYQSWVNPVNVLKRQDIATEVLSERSYLAKDAYNKRIFTDIVLKGKKNLEVRFTVSLPEKKTTKSLKCILLAAGLETGQKSLSYIEDHTDYAIIAYEYPSIIKSFNNGYNIFQIGQLRDAIISLPQQWLSIIYWAQKKTWCQQKSLSITGFSFGAIFVPAAYHLAQVQRIQLNKGVIAYGGAGIKCLLQANLKLNKWLKIPVVWFANILFRPIDPLIHAKYLQNYFLLINGLQDKKIPSKCRLNLQRSVPYPKKVVNLDTEHMSVDNQKLLNNLVKISKDFLEN